MFTAQNRYGRDPGVVTKTKTWGEPYKWQKALEGTAKTEMVFTCSWSDWFHEHADGWRAEAWQIIRETPSLIYQILTKRPERIAECLPPDWKDGYPNVWLGVSVETQQYWDIRVPILGGISAAIRFVSYEPALGPIQAHGLTRVDWVICGGESGPGWRDMPLEWARSMRDQCKAAGVAFFFKQSAAPRTEMGIAMDGEIIREYPTPRKTGGSSASESPREKYLDLENS
jgi:protein gp37